MLDIGLEFRKGILFVRLSGSLTKNNVYKLKKEVELLIRDNGFYQIVLNVKQVDKVDIEGFDSLYTFYHFLMEKGGKMLLCIDENSYLSRRNMFYSLKHEIKTIRSEIDAFGVLAL